MTGNLRVRLFIQRGRDLNRTIADLDRTQLSVEREHDSPHTLVVRNTHGLEANKDSNTLIQANLDLASGIQAVEVLRRWDHGDVAKLLLYLLELLGGSREEQVVEAVAALL